MIFEVIRGGGKTGRPILSPGKKLNGGKFRPVTPVTGKIYLHDDDVFALDINLLQFVSPAMG